MSLPEKPYSSPVAELRVKATKSNGYRMLIGFLIGALLPLGAGIYALLRSQIHAESNSTGGIAYGIVPLHALLLIFIVSPLLGTVGAIVARFLRK